MSARHGHSAASDALTKVLARSRRLANATRPVRDALSQAEHYADLRGRRHPVRSMSAPEALLVLALLERHAETLHGGELGEHLLQVAHGSEHEREQAIEAGRQAASIDAATWLRQTPLHRALTERASQ
jgi:hypothetical protein